jgi:hypothetical protein
MCLNPGRVGHDDAASSVLEGEPAEILCLPEHVQEWEGYLVKCYGFAVTSHIRVIGTEDEPESELPKFRQTDSAEEQSGYTPVFLGVSTFCRERGLVFVDYLVS